MTESTTAPLDEGYFEGDEGTLPIEARVALAALLKKTYVSAERDPAVWRALEEHRTVVGSRLNDLLLRLVVDRDYRIAYKEQVRLDGVVHPILLRSTSYNREATILMVHLRSLYRAGGTGADEAGGAVFVERQDLVEEVLTYEHRGTNRKRDLDAASKAVTTLARDGILIGSSAEADSFRISPVVELLVTVETLRRLTAWLTEQAQDGGQPDDARTEPEETESEEDA